jgi:hypothetical protein
MPLVDPAFELLVRFAIAGSATFLCGIGLSAWLICRSYPRGK